MTPGEWGQWYYLIYLLPLGLSALLVLVSALGGGHRGGRVGHGMGATHGGGHGLGTAHGGHGGEALHPPAPGGRLGHVPGIGHLKGVGHGRAVASGAHRTPPHDAASAAKESQQDPLSPAPPEVNPLLALLGVGRVPALFLLQGFGLFWGVIGFYASRMLESQGATPAAFIGPALGMAAAGGLLGAKAIGGLGSRLMPTEESFALDSEGLIGGLGTVVFPVTATTGRIHVFDASGSLHDESARLLPDPDDGVTRLERGETVLLVDYDEAAGCYRVQRSPV